MRLWSRGDSFQDHAGKTDQRLPVLLVLLVIVASVAVRTRLLDLPLERDEGEYAYIAQLMLNGFLPYVDVYSMKLPGIYWAYSAVVSLFGASIEGVRLALILVHSASICLLFLLAKRLTDSWTGVLAAAFFAFFSLSPFTHGLFANAEHFVLLPAIGGLAALIKALDEDRLLLLLFSGLLLGTGFLMKQHGIAFVILAGAYLLLNGLTPINRPAQRFAFFGIGAMLPYVLVCLFFWNAGVFENFWYWTFEYAGSYASMVTSQEAWSGFKDRFFLIVASAPLIWGLCIAGICFGWKGAFVGNRRAFIPLFFLFSALSICPGFYFRPHYFLLLLPAAGLMGAIGFRSILKLLSSHRSRHVQIGLTALLIMACFAPTLYQQREYFFSMSSEEVCRMIFPMRPFPESIEISRYIRANTNSEDRIAVIGSEPQIYFYSQRRSATGYIYMYPMMEQHSEALRMQENMIREIEAVQPVFLIFVNAYTSWLKKSESHDLIFKWFHRYRTRYYEPIGFVEIYPDRSEYRWGENLKMDPKADAWIAVLKRKAN